MPAGTTNLPSSRLPMIPLRISTAALRWIFVWVVLLSSVTSLIQASGVAGGSTRVDVVALASVEIAAIIAFATERFRGWAAVALLIVFAVAFVGSAVEGEFGARFIYFAASTIYLQGSERRFSQGQLLG
jgi:hypothetical protein